MCDIAQVLPGFQAASFAHLIPSLDRQGVTVGDLISAEPLDVARRVHLPPTEVKRLIDALVAALQADSKRDLEEWSFISCLDPLLDRALGGGFPVGHLSEITGERCVETP
jgi:DNA repair protein RAD57